MRQILDFFMIFGVITLVFLLSFFESKFSHTAKKFMILGSTLLLSVIIGLKVIGLDHQNYVEMYLETPIIPLNFIFLSDMFKYSLEPIFIALISILKARGFGTNAFFFVSAIIPLLLIWAVIVKKEKKFPLTVFFFFLALKIFAGPVDTIRHFFAAAIYLYALYLLSENKRVRFYTASFISVLAHYSNLVVFIVRPLLTISWNRKSYLVTLVSMGLFAIVFKNGITELILGLNTEAQLIWKLQYYLLRSTDDINFQNNFHVVLWTLLTYMIVAFTIIINIIALKYRNEFEKDRFYYLLLNSQIIGSLAVVFFTAFNAHNFGLRINFLLSIGIFFIVKELLGKVKAKKAFLFFTMFFIVLYNLVILMYFAGVYSPLSRFSLV